jgi:hypothetical protein
VEILADHKGVTLRTFPEEGKKTVQETDSRTYKETQYDILADGVRAALPMDKIYAIMDKYMR